MPIEVSVVIPCYNRGRFIAEAIDSALAQGEDCETVVVDDGSTDDSWTVIGSYGDRVRAFRIANGGVSRARNHGVAQARGRFVKFLDSDDRLPPGAVASLLHAQQTSKPNQILFGDAVLIDEVGRPATGIDYGYARVARPGLLARATLLGGIMAPVLPLYPREVLENVGGFDETITLSEDQDLAIRLVALGYEFHRLPVSVMEVREHGGPRLSRNYGRAGFDTLLRLYRRWVDLLGSSFTPEEKVALARRAWADGRSASRQGHPENAAALFELSRSLAGRHGEEGSALIKLAYRITTPYCAERVFGWIKCLQGAART